MVGGGGGGSEDLICLGMDSTIDALWASTQWGNDANRGEAGQRPLKKSERKVGRSHWRGVGGAIIGCGECNLVKLSSEIMWLKTVKVRYMSARR